MKEPASLPELDVLVLGAGAAGLMCARTASLRGRRTALADRHAAPGRKLSASGGGKANFTNLRMDPAHYLGDAAFCEPALEAFTPRHMLDFMARHRLAWEEREHGRLFGLARAQTLADALTADCLNAGCRFFMGRRVERVEKHAGGFAAFCHDGSSLHAGSLVLATGSPAWPSLGADDAGARWALRMGHKTRPFRPILAPLYMPPDWPLHGLAGVSLPATLTVADYVCTDHLLFTHDGLSGPAALQASCSWESGRPIMVDFLPGLDFGDLLDAPHNGKFPPRSLLARHMPKRLADALLPPETARRKSAELSRAWRRTLRQAVHAHCVTPVGIAGMDKAEAAAGGVRTEDVDAWSMESLLVPGLFIVGELLDVAGRLGGYNLHWAWASGYLAGSRA